MKYSIQFDELNILDKPEDHEWGSFPQAVYIEILRMVNA